jgi:hypothetical protein
MFSDFHYNVRHDVAKFQFDDFANQAVTRR